ncbi:MAG: hypothetical protein WCO60_13630 [Verrucomicrobiota bacterium]
MTLIRSWQYGHRSGSVRHTFRITSIHFSDGGFAGGGEVDAGRKGSAAIPPFATM